MALNLVRNSKVLFSTNVNTASGVLQTSGYGPNNTTEILVLDGITFNQNTTNETITVNEAGAAPVRGQRSFNTALAPVDFSFSTYFRPKNATTKITADESVLWNAFFGTKTIGTTVTSIAVGSGGTGTISSITYASATGQVSIAGTGLPTAGLAVSDRVILSGITASSGANTAFFNNYGTVVSVSASTTIVALANAPTVASTLSGSAVTISKVGSSTGFAQNTVVLGTGGTGTVSGLTYTYTAATGEGVINISGSGLPTTTSTLAVGEVVSIGGIATTSVTASASASFVNAAAVVKSVGTASIQLSLVNVTTSAITFGTISSVTLYKSAWVENGTNYSYTTSAASDVHLLQKCGMLIEVDTVMYAIDNAVLTQATIDFAIDGIATVQWTGQASQLRKVGDTTDTGTMADGKFFAGSGTNVAVGSYATAVSDAKYIANKLSTAKLVSANNLKNTSGSTIIAAGDTYNLAITGGSITINNNVTFQTPANIGIVNTPITYFTGTRAVTGSLNCYLRTGTANDVGNLLDEMLQTINNNTEPMFTANINIGGETASTPRIGIELPSAVITVPSVEVAQLINTTINFTAEGSAPITGGYGFDLSKTNDVTLKYYV